MRQPGSKSLSILIFTLVLPASVRADSVAAPEPAGGVFMHWEVPNASRQSALELARGTASRAYAAELLKALHTAPDTLAAKIETTAASAELPWPALEAALMALEDALVHKRREQVPAALMRLLSNWQALTLVPHEESASVGDALFSIAARAQGLENRWRHDEARVLGAKLLTQGADRFLSQWSVQTDAASRAGLLDALDRADRDALRAIVADAQNVAKSTADLRAPASRAALALHDVDAMATMIAFGAGAETRALLQATAERLNADELTALLLKLRRDADTAQLALAIGVWSQALAGHQRAEQLLLDWLEDAELGSSAALALSLRPTPETRAKLHVRAAVPDTSLAAQRARLALQLDQDSELPL